MIEVIGEVIVRNFELFFIFICRKKIIMKVLNVFFNYYCII